MSQFTFEGVQATLKSGIHTVVFEKDNGEERTMKCTLQEDQLPGSSNEAQTANKTVLPVYDTEAEAWRSFRINSIKSVD